MEIRSPSGCSFPPSPANRKRFAQHADGDEMGPEDYDKIEKELEAEEMRARALERELADQREAFERAQRALAREREEKVQPAIEFEEREMEMKAQQKEMEAQIGVGVVAP